MAFDAHNDAVRRAVPADRLLVYEVREGWGPLCEFLGTAVPDEEFLGTAVPDEEFPRTNDRAEFWELVKRSL